MNRILAVFLFLAQISVLHAGEYFPEGWLKAEHKKVYITERNDHLYPMIHLKNSGKTPVILLHGYGGSEHNWMDLGPELKSRGFDVWVFRWSADNGRNVERSAAETVGEIVDYVYKKTGKKSVLVGHSMGGIISKLYAFGLYKNPATGFYELNAKRRTEISGKVAALISISSPNGLHQKKIPFVDKLFAVEREEDQSKKNLSDIINERSTENEEAALEKMENLLFFSGMTPVRFLLKGVTNLTNHEYGDYTLARAYRYGGGPLTKAVVDQIKSGHTMDTTDSKVSYTKTFTSGVRNIPFAFIGGESDSLAPAKAVKEEAEGQNAPYIELKDAGHLDTLTGVRMRESCDFIEKFVRAVYPRN